MAELTDEGRRAVADIAERHGVSPDAAAALFAALVAGHGTQAQFNVPELGGMGQWSSGGMVMVGDMFNNALKARVDAICRDLAGLVGRAGLLARPARGDWWPAEFGTPSAVGGQNDSRYAFFPVARRLAVQQGGQVTVYDTADHDIRGFAQQQPGAGAASFTSQHGAVRLADLAIVREPGSPAGPEPVPAPAPRQEAPAMQPPGVDDVFVKIERLAELHARGILGEAEFEAKKAELLGRL